MGSVLVLSVQDPTPDPVVIGSRISELVPDPVQPGPNRNQVPVFAQSYSL